MQLIDCDYVFPRFAGAYLLREGDRAAFVDNNTAHSVPLLLAALAREGLEPAAVDYVIITHVHLDHAGGSQALMDACPNAQLLAHPRAARHVIDPTKLVASARQVYGVENFARLYGEIGPVAEARVRAMADGEEMAWGSRRFRFLHTRGHANHHFCVQYGDASGFDSIFTGDSFGLAYPDLQREGLFIFPSTSPTDFDPEEAMASVDRIVATGASRAYLTHFGEVSDLPAAGAQLKTHLEFSREVLKMAVAEPPSRDADLESFCGGLLNAYFDRLLAEKGLTDQRRLVEMDLRLNAEGIAFVARKIRDKNI